MVFTNNDRLFTKQEWIDSYHGDVSNSTIKVTALPFCTAISQSLKCASFLARYSIIINRNRSVVVNRRTDKRIIQLLKHILLLLLLLLCESHIFTSIIQTTYYTSRHHYLTVVREGRKSAQIVRLSSGQGFTRGYRLSGPKRWNGPWRKTMPEIFSPFFLLLLHFLLLFLFLAFSISKQKQKPRRDMKNLYGDIAKPI